MDGESVTPPEYPALLLLYFTPEELASLTSDEIRLLLLLDREELPEVSDLEQARAIEEYRARVMQHLHNSP